MVRVAYRDRIRGRQRRDNHGRKVSLAWARSAARSRIEGLGLVPRRHTYFGPTTIHFMVNHRVHDLRGLLDRLRTKAYGSMTRSRSSTTASLAGSKTLRAIESSSGRRKVKSS